MFKIKNYNKNIFILIFSSIFIIFFLIDLFTENNFLLSNLLPHEFKVIFADLTTIIPSINELKQIYLLGTEKISSNEISGRPMNYPDIWVYIFNFIKIFGNPVYLFGTFQIIIYLIFSKIILFKNKSFNYIYFLVLFSPVMILMLERGNNDLSIFFILFLSIISRNYLSGLLLGLAISLKIFPIVLLPAFVILNKVNKKFILGFLVTVPLIIWALFNIKTSITNTDVVASFGASFGIYSLSMFLIKFLQDMFLINLSKEYLFYINLIFIFLFIILSILFNYFFKKDLIHILDILKKNKKDFVLFVLFSTQVILVFFAFSNYAYRIIFLLMPLLIFIKNINNFIKFNNLKKISFTLLASAPFLTPWIILSFNETSKNHHIWILYSVITFISFIFYFTLLSKFYFKKIIHFFNYYKF
jgi:hypothetical protein